MTEKDLTIQELRRKLKAYEDTGLTPEELEDYKILCESYVKAGLDAKFVQACIDIVTAGVTVDLLCRLMEAEKDGRLVMLPCKVGETAWVKDRAGVPREMRLKAPDIRFVCTDEDDLCGAICNRTPDGLCVYRIKNDGSDVGKKVFLTREEEKKGRNHETNI